MRASIPDLNEVTIFARVAQHGSFSVASKTLRIPVSMASRKVAQLEKRLGVLLIKRTTRKLNLTDAGARYYERCAEHLRGLEEAEADVTNTRGEIEGLLRISAPVALGRGDFLKFISSFLSAHPKISIDLVVTNQFIDLVTGNIDLGIRYGPLSDSSAVIARRLGTSPRVLVASPSYLKKSAEDVPRVPQDLRNHSCVLFRAGRTEESRWELFDGKSTARPQVAGKVSANTFDAVLELAENGNGIALVPKFLAVVAEKRASVVRVLPRWTSAKIPVHVVYMGRGFLPAKVETLIKALSEWKTSNWE
jgi:DNA-binding transcriptional LysR family regulator